MRTDATGSGGTGGGMITNTVASPEPPESPRSPVRLEPLPLNPRKSPQQLISSPVQQQQRSSALPPVMFSVTGHGRMSKARTESPDSQLSNFQDARSMASGASSAYPLKSVFGNDNGHPSAPPLSSSQLQQQRSRHSHSLSPPGSPRKAPPLPSALSPVQSFQFCCCSFFLHSLCLMFFSRAALVSLCSKMSMILPSLARPRTQMTTWRLAMVALLPCEVLPRVERRSLP